uniref:SEA domain-containing protein n=1 Tax=Strongyloides stercoralis TaxID=6248 RepID=A0A0K0EP24_STRER
MLLKTYLLLSIFAIGNVFIFCEDNVNVNKKDTTSNISTSSDNGTMENVSRIYPSYINELIIAGSGYNKNILKEMEIKEKLEKIILISIQLSLSNHLSKKSISNEENNININEFYWDFQMPTEDEINEVNMTEAYLITEKNTINVNITGIIKKMGNTILYFMVQYKNRTIHSDIISENLSLLTLSHISAFLGLPVIEINSMLNIGQLKKEGNNWWIIILMFASGLILFFICWCMLFIYFNTCGQLSYRYSQKTTSLVNNNNNNEVPNKNTSNLERISSENELKKDDKNIFDLDNNLPNINNKNGNIIKKINKDISKINLFTNVSDDLTSMTSINSETVTVNKNSSDDEKTINLEKNDTYRNSKKINSSYITMKNEIEDKDINYKNEDLNDNNLQKNNERRKRPLSAKIRSPAFKDVNKFKNILKEEKVIIQPEVLVNDEWNPYQSGDYIAKHFVSNMDLQFYPSPKKVFNDKI